MRRMKKTITFGIGLVLIAGMARLSMAQDGVAAYLVMIGNQGTQIANQVQQIQTMQNQITQSIASLQQYRDAALGQIGAIIAPIRDLMAVPSGLLDQARDWQDDFTGTAGEMAGTLNDFRDGASLTDGWRDILAAADTVREADIRATYARGPRGRRPGRGRLRSAARGGGPAHRTGEHPRGCGRLGGRGRDRRRRQDRRDRRPRTTSAPRRSVRPSWPAP